MRKKILQKSVDSVIRRKAKRSRTFKVKKIAEWHSNKKVLAKRAGKKTASCRLAIKCGKLFSLRNIMWRAAFPSVFLNFQDGLKKLTAVILIFGLNLPTVLSIEETQAYLSDIEISKNNQFNAAKLDFSLEFLMSDGFRTQTQGGWGSKPHGGNPGSYLEENFDDAFTDGVTIGDSASGYYAHFSSSESIEDFLPAGKSPGFFSISYDDPDETQAGVLAGQVLALKLNVGFDAADEDFSVNESKLSQFHASDLGAPCEKMYAEDDMTVDEILSEANLVLSGQSDRFTPEEMNDCISEINERFDNGLTKKITPSESVWREITIIKNEGMNFQHSIRAEQESGNEDLCESFLLDAYLNGVHVYSGKLMDFEYKNAVFSDSANKWRLYLSLPKDASSLLNSEECGLKYIISGWQEDFGEPDEGLSDSEEISDFLKSGEWVSGDEEASGFASLGEEVSGVGFITMNEFLPNPEGEKYGFDFGNDTSPMPRGEWIELYNSDNAEHDLEGWYFQDLDKNIVKITSENSSLDSTVIPAKKWMVVYMNKDFLDNTENETVTLYESSGNVVDMYSYSGSDYCDLEPTSGNTNFNDPSGQCSSVPFNKSYARIPDVSGEWFDPIPTPGRSNETPENLLDIDPLDLGRSDSGDAAIDQDDSVLQERDAFPSENNIGEPEPSDNKNLNNVGETENVNDDNQGKNTVDSSAGGETDKKDDIPSGSDELIIQAVNPKNILSGDGHDGSEGEELFA